MRRKEKQMNDQAVLRILRDGEYGVLGTAGEDGCPYTTPLNYVFEDNCIYLHCALEGRKIENINFNNKVSFCVVGRAKVLPAKFSTAYESAIAFGEASFVEGEDKKEILMKFIEKYSSGYKLEGLVAIEKAFSKVKIVKISVESITGKENRES
ncbi:pyridoxamine 5'-phosphate oxidase family protein [Desulfotomaculum copahuensis]|nr:pyridoxamine 5'-phosphate oxidase family protein [Desulfotomaculum copahuensis]